VLKVASSFTRSIFINNKCTPTNLLLNYDEIRHFVFSFPPLSENECCLEAVTSSVRFDVIIEKLENIDDFNVVTLRHKCASLRACAECVGQKEFKGIGCSFVDLESFCLE